VSVIYSILFLKFACYSNLAEKFGCINYKK